MKWTEVENQVRLIASYLWDSPCRPEEINGVKLDGVIRLRSDHWVLIEITQEEDLAKLRTDIGKFSGVRNYLFAKNIFPECFFVCENKPNPSLYTTGEGSNIKVLSMPEFESLFLDYPRYHHARIQLPFGSALDPVTGDKDIKSYVPVKYIDIKTGNRLNIEDIARALMQSRKIVLLGNYGTGKSRCIQEIFGYFKDNLPDKAFFPIAIDLRHNWGTKRASEIIRRHFDDLGLSNFADSVIKVIPKGSVAFLLDGFDEISSQAWTDMPQKLADIRRASLLGVRDSIEKNKGGLLISGREHYFNSNDEMFQCLGLKENQTILLRCQDEFTFDEMNSYLSQIEPNLTLPEWLPRRPLMCQVIMKLRIDEIKSIINSTSGEIDFWYTLMPAICERDSRINVAFDATTIRSVMRRLARITRNKPQDVGPLSTSEIKSAFEEVTGHLPVDESIMLQRLPALGRISSESNDRQFIDYYILDGLRAEDLIDEVIGTRPSESKVIDSNWINPLCRFGLSLTSRDLTTSCNENCYMNYLDASSSHLNKIIAGDIIASKLAFPEKAADFGGYSLSDSHISFLDLSKRAIGNLTINDTVIDELDITECNVRKVKLSQCIIGRVYGVSAQRGMPDWIEGCNIDNYDSISTVSRIKVTNLSSEQRIFITIIKKLFFQPGKGRKEEALLRGLSESPNKKAADKIVKMLMRENIIDRRKGDEGWVYHPKRENAKRMDAILTELSLSRDPLWLNLSIDKKKL